MAVRIRSKFHQGGRQRAPAELASAVAVLGWKLAIESIKRMRRAEYDIDVGRPYFEFVSEFMVFFAVAADRIAFRELVAEERSEFTTALVVRMAERVEENFAGPLGEEPGTCQRGFLDRFNRRSADYAEFGYDENGPDFGFKRYFAACLREVLPEKDQLWVVDQAMEIEAPDALKALEKTLDGLFKPAGHTPPKQAVTVIG
jgi:hypothetical protein